MKEKVNNPVQNYAEIRKKTIEFTIRKLIAVSSLPVNLTHAEMIPKRLGRWR